MLALAPKSFISYDDFCYTLGFECHSKGERVAWSPAEDMRIIESVQQLGLKWSAIEKRLPGRTAHAIQQDQARRRRPLWPPQRLRCRQRRCN